MDNTTKNWEESGLLAGLPEEEKAGLELLLEKVILIMKRYNTPKKTSFIVLPLLVRIYRQNPSLRHLLEKEYALENLIEDTHVKRNNFYSNDHMEESVDNDAALVGILESHWKFNAENQ